MLRIFRNLSRRDTVCVLIAIGFIVLQVWLDLRMPDYMTEITQLVQTPGNEISQVVVAGLKMLGCALGSLAAAACVAVLVAKIATGFSADVRSAVYHKVMDFSKPEISSFSTASLITRTTNDITQVQLLIIMGMQSVIKAPLLGTWAVIKIAGKDLSWTLATGVAMGVLLTIAVVGIILMLPKFQIVQELTDDLNRVTLENLSGLRVIRAYNADDYQEEKFDKANTDLTDLNLFTGKVMAFVSPTISIILNGLSLSIYWIGAYLIDKAAQPDKLPIFSDMIVFTQYAMQVFMAFMMLIVMLVIFPRAAISAKRVLAVLDTDIAVTDGEETCGMAGQEGTIEFRNVSFRYPGSAADVLHDISFTAGKGETVAFIGATGSGKSTLVDLIPRFFDATEGEVLVNGRNVKEYTLEALRGEIGYVSQRAVLFSGSVESNVVMGESGEEPEGSLDRALKIAQAEEFVSNMPEGVDSEVAQGGNNLSGGQKQRLSIARAIYRNPDILIFDDSFSALDYKTDRQLRDELDRSCADATRLIVAQRIGTIRDADRIIVLDEGEMVGCGTHSELLNSCEVYRQIAYSQLTKEELE
ncbi:MAG: ABC transporter ATP-binding protein [Ruminococcaceae bacterium]|nr:ABC transporter ATP-binding protein [Oscillospiraceae bacterium]